MRRKEFEETDRKVALEVLDSARIGHLAGLDDLGLPVVLPFNFVRVGEQVVMHGSPRGFLAKRIGQQVRFLAYDRVTWIPSTWRHPELACPATTFYRSVLLTGLLGETTELEQKGRFLQKFMERYQPEGGYRPIEAEHPLYKGPLSALTVLHLGIEKFECKVKMGQHLTGKQRLGVIQGLLGRDAAGDRDCALEVLQQHAGSA